MGALGFMSNDLFTYFLTFLKPTDVCRLGMLSRFFHALLEPQGYVWRQIYIHSPYYDPQVFKEAQQQPEYNWKVNYLRDFQSGWRFDTSPLRCGEGFVISKKRLTCRTNKNYKGPVIVQRVFTERGVWRGRHLFSVAISGVCISSASFGVCKGKNVPPHGYIAGVAIFAGDGTLDTIPIVTNAVQEGRRKGRMSTNDVVTVELDLDQHHVNFYVNGAKWATVDGVENETDPALWYFYVSVRNYSVPYNRGEQLYRIVPHPAPLDEGQV